jgi:hypothetical protein
VKTKNEVNARKEAIDNKSAWKILAQCERIFIAKGKKILEYSPDPAQKDIILKDAMGRSGNLRAPTIKVGSDCYIGFNSDMYDAVIKTNS